MNKKVVIVGGVAAGPKAACHLKRIQPGWDVTVVDQDSMISYGGCGTPYYVGGDVTDETELRSTAFRMVRDVPFSANAKGVEVLVRTKALAIDRQNKKLRVKNLDSGEEQELPYDKLMLTTGA
ncbi:MAG: pyridine nucleotide-disulfide oxidoreductase, partial [Candidatus Electrothrix sp. AUS4]|nr:pyridine nucleotide-disulfide oxidoreductase [Candidatus Electrothrix sp. AUS4]